MDTEAKPLCGSFGVGRSAAQTHWRDLGKSVSFLEPVS